MAIRNPFNVWSALCALIFLVHLQGCEGSATQTTTGPGLRGTLVDSLGNPIAGAKVLAWAAGGDSSPLGTGSRPVAITHTDAAGAYLLSGMEVGEYTVFGEKAPGDVSVLIPAVQYSSHDLDLGIDTLLPPGSITGRVFAGGDPLAEAFCFIPGSSFIALTDSAGGFLLDKVPAGSYTFKYVRSGYETVMTGPVRVESGKTTRLGDRDLKVDVSLQPPAPNGLTAYVDTTTGIVHLSWKKAGVDDVRGYEIKVRFAGDTLLRNGERTVATMDSILADSITRYRFQGYYDSARLDTLDLRYSIRSLDADGNRSPSFSPEVQVRLPRPTSMSGKVTVAYAEGPSTAFRCRDTLIFTSSFAGPGGDSALTMWALYRLGPDSLGPSYPADTLYSTEGEDRLGRLGRSDTLTWGWGKGLKTQGPVGEDPARNGKPQKLLLVAATSISLPGLGYGDWGEAYSYRTTNAFDIDVDESGCFKIGAPRSGFFGFWWRW